MGFPVPGDAFEQSLDLNRQLVKNPAATFFMQVEGDLQPNHEVQPGDLLGGWIALSMGRTNL